MTSPSELDGARTLGGWELVRELGRGGMGAVYAARRPGSTREVALKVLLPAASRDPEAHERFRREALATARLSHPNIVGIEDYGVAGAYPFIVMKLADGPSLREALRAGPLAPERAGRIALRLARALAHAHERGVLHRDLKPENVLLAEDDEPRLTDFGLAKLVGGDARERLTRTGDVVGTPCYMAPEQTGAASANLIDARTDVYALGATLYELLAGRPPFLGVSVIAVLADVATRPPEPLDRIRPELPPALVAICQRCLEKEPSRRFASAAELAAALEETLAPPAAPAERTARARAASLALAGAVLALGAIAAAALLAHGRGEPVAGGVVRGSAGAADAVEAPPAAPPPVAAAAEDPAPARPPVAERAARPPTAEERRRTREGLQRLQERVPDAFLGTLAPQDVTFFEELAADHPFLGFPHLLRAMALHRIGRDIDALAALDAAEAAPVPYGGFFVEAFRGRWLHEQGRLAEALPHLQSAWDHPDTTVLEPVWAVAGVGPQAWINPRSREQLPDVAALLLDTLHALGHDARGAQLGDGLRERLPHEAWQPFERLAWCLAGAGRLSDALEACDAAHERSGRRQATPLTTKGRLLARHGKWEAAARAIERAAEDVPRAESRGVPAHPDVYLARAELKLAEAKQAPASAWSRDGFASPAASALQPIVNALQAWRSGLYVPVLVPPASSHDDPLRRARQERRQVAARRAHVLRCLEVYGEGLRMEGQPPDEVVRRLLVLLAEHGAADVGPADPAVQALCDRLRRGG